MYVALVSDIMAASIAGDTTNAEVASAYRAYVENKESESGGGFHVRIAFDRVPMEAVSAGDEVGVKDAISHGADMHASEEDFGSMTQEAPNAGHGRIVEMSIWDVADVGADDYFCLLEVAASNGDEQLVEFLMSKGANVKAWGGRHESVLLAAAVGGHARILKLLIANGVGFQSRGECYSTAVEVAEAGGHVEVLEMLQERGRKMYK